MSIGCIQAQKCHDGHCPAGVATQNWWLQRGLDVDDKTNRAARYTKGFRKELLSLAHAAGYVELFYGYPRNASSWELATDALARSKSGALIGGAIVYFWID